MQAYDNLLTRGLMEEDFSKFIEEIKSKSDIVQVINHYVPLEKKGNTYWGRCPFHGEKTPSFAVNELGQFYHCFGCKAGGDVIKFIQEIESVEFNDAIAILAEKLGIVVPNFTSGESRDKIAEKKQYKDRLLTLMKDAARHYHENLFSGKAPEAWEYLFNKRKVPRDVAIQFGMGASLNYQEIIEFLRSKGYSDKEMLDAGVVKHREGGGLYDAYGKRLIFPNIDIFGNVIGFCGRILVKSEFAKYLNTSETILFSKGKTLYGINLVKKKKQSSQGIPYMIIVEGQMDTVSLHKAGFDTAVASMGTALTQDQARLIKRFTDNVFICYDGDFAGQKATIRGLEILSEEGLNVKVVNLPDGLDPDDVINKFGADGFKKLLKNALPLIEFKLDMVKKHNDLTTREGKAKYINEALEILRPLDEVNREVYIGLVSELSNTNIEFLKRQLAGDVVTKQNNSGNRRFEPTREAVKDLDSALVKAQKFVLSSMINLKPYAFLEKPIAEILAGEEFVKIGEAVDLSKGSVSAEQMIRRVREYSGEELIDLVDEIINYVDAFATQENESKFFKDSLWIVYKAFLDRELDRLNALLSETQDNAERKDIMFKIANILNQIKLKKVELW